MPLRPAVSAAAKQTMEVAYEQLRETMTLEDFRELDGATLEDVRKAALGIENQMAARKSLRNMRRLVPLLAGLEHYSKVVDVLCNGTPFLPWIWAPITLIIRVSYEYVEAFEKIIKGYSEITASLSRFQTLSETLKTDMDFQLTLAAFYADILQFHRHAYEFVRRKSWSLLFLTSWGRFERKFENIIEDMKRHAKLVDLQASAIGISDVRQMRDEIQSWREESESRLRQHYEDKAAREFESIISWLKSEESDQLALLDTLSAEGTRFAGTASWALKNPKIKSWLQPKADQCVLWLHGTAGSGKSVLAGQIVRFMKSANMYLICHFCSQKYASSTSYEQILRSILLQLIRKDDELVAHVYTDCVLGKRPPTIQALERLLLKLFNIASRNPRQREYIWIIIDGLNECETRRQSSVVNLINQITSKIAGDGDTICKILIASRNAPHIANKLRNKQIVSLTEEKTSMKLAIRQYVSQRLRSMHEQLRQLELSRKDIDEIESVITNKADGMFLYARLVLDYLSKNIFYTGKEIKAAIDGLPEELTEFYQKILMQILVHLNPQSVKRIKSIFSWIAFAKRPLKRMEFLSALTFSEGRPDVNSLVPKYVLDTCGALVEERPDTTLTFIHISVKDFLQSPTSNLYILENEALAEHCFTTLTCLLSGVDIFLEEDTEYTKKAHRVVKGIHGLHVYATEFWTEYLMQQGSSTSFAVDGLTIGQLATKLASKLSRSLDIDETPQARETTVSDATQGLTVEQQSLLKRLVDTTLTARSLKRLEDNLNYELQKDAVHRSDIDAVDSGLTRPPENKVEEDKISKMLSSYQEVVRFLLKQDQYPGVSADDLEQFKSQFQSSAFTCRLSFCPRATVGFVSEDLRRQHEIAHTQLSSCPAPGCKYPPFPSSKALNRHINQYHSPQPDRKSIRRVGHTPIRRPRLIMADDQDSGSSGTEMEKSTLVEFDVPSNILRTPQEKVGRVLTYGRDPHPDRPVASRTVSDSFKVDSRFPIRDDAIGYLGCTMPGCNAKLNGIELDDPFVDGAPEMLSLHYWNHHHADSSMARCALGSCQKIFPTRPKLQQHYEKKHTARFCSRCDANHPEGFALKGELRRHWWTHHLERLQRWKCVKSSRLEGFCGGGFEVKPCESCAVGHKYDRLYDALKHLRATHWIAQTDNPNKAVSNEFLRDFVEEVWVYKEVGGGETGQGSGRIDASESEDSEDDDSDDMMFHVPELA